MQFDRLHSNQKFIHRLIFFIGWTLSPFTPWNDPVVNIPLAFVIAVLFTSLIKVNFLAAVITAYWLTNGLGLALMYYSGKGLFKKGQGVGIEVFKLVLTGLFYTIIILLIYKIVSLK